MSRSTVPDIPAEHPDEAEEDLPKYKGKKKGESLLSEKPSVIEKAFDPRQPRAPDGKWIRSATPAEIDTKLFPVVDKIAHHEHVVNARQDELANGRIRRGFGSRPDTREPLNEYDKRNHRSAIERSQKEIDQLEKVARPLEEEFDRRGGWKRYVVVPGGHLHKRHCHTLTPGRTMVGQTPEASGLDDKHVVGHFGEGACTHCFPDAPVIDRAAASSARRATREAEREEKRKTKLFRAADRATKLIAKAEKWLKDNNHTWESMMARPPSGPGSAYGATSEAPSQVSDYILDEVKRHHGERPWNKDPKQIIEEARALGWTPSS